MRPKSPAFAHDHLLQVGGAEQVLRQLTTLYPTAPLYTLVCKRSKFDFLKDTDIRPSYLQYIPGGTAFFKFFLGLMPTVWEQTDFSKHDLVISSASAFVKGIVVPPGTMHVSYCHSPTRYLWSDSEEYVDNLRLPFLARRALMRLLTRLREWDRMASQRVDQFIANSAFIAKRIKNYYDRESTVIYPPVDTSQFALSKGTEPYFLIVSRLRPYKRVDLAIDAFNNLKLPLVIIGGGEELPKLKSRARKNIRFLGEVSDTVRNQYLARCRAFIHPQEEDFGISAVEAMASGRPVIAYRAGGARETIVENVTGAFFDDQTWESLAYSILTLKDSIFDPHTIQNHARSYDTSVFMEKMRAFIADLPAPS